MGLLCLVYVNMHHQNDNDCVELMHIGDNSMLRRIGRDIVVVHNGKYLYFVFLIDFILLN